MNEGRYLHSDDDDHYSLFEVTSHLQELEQFEETISRHRLPPDVKPCLLKVLNGRELPKTMEMWKVPCVIAGELRRVGQTAQQVTRALKRWHRASTSEIDSAVRTTFEKGYEFGCPSLERLNVCLYESRYDCPWYARIPKKGWVRYRERDFHRFGWPKSLLPSEQCIYFAIREIEKKRRFPAGTKLYASERELAEVAGIDRKTVRTRLPELKRKGLIDFQKGRRHKHYGIAGEIRRIIPIPRPK